MSPLSILVVEDEHDIAELLVHLLQDEGYRVRSAENGVVAMAMLSKEPVDLLLTDISMPVMGGVELIERVRSNPHMQHLPILVLSALSEEFVRVKWSLGARLVQKPFRTRHLMAQVGELLGQRVSATLRSVE